MKRTHVQLPMDPRSVHFATTDQRSLEAAAAAMPTSKKTPQKVSEALLRARRQFMLGGVDYDNFVDAFSTALKAVEMLLREVLGEQAPRRATMANLIEKSGSLGLLTPYDREYLQQFALHFRNKLAHPDGPLAFPPGLSELVVAGCHRFVVAYSDQHF